MLTLYPPLEPRRSGWLAVGEGHEVWFEDCGNPEGLPVVFLHGGPGSGCRSYHRQFFDPLRYRILLLDQRGAGRSRPLGAVLGNHTDALVADLETLRLAMQVERWVVFGGSWGATLALCYASQHPERTLALVLRGSFLARQCDLDWFFVNGAKQMLPDAWAALKQAFPGIADPDLFAEIYRRVFEWDQTPRAEARRLAAAQAWNDWGGAVATASVPPVSTSPPARIPDTATLLATSRIELHYAAARYFLVDQPLLSRISTCPRVPTTIVHGQRDLTCMPSAALTLHQALPWAERIMVREAGHIASEPAMVDALVGIMNQLPDHLI